MDPLTLASAVVLFSLLGLTAGIATGLAPGLHVNNVALVLLASRTAFEGLVRAIFPAAGPEDSVLALSAFVMGAVIGHGFLDFVPSVYLGAPEERTALAVLPGHRLLLAGEGHAAVRHAARGALAGTVVATALLVPVRLLLGPPVGAYGAAEGAIAAILLGIVALLILAEGARTGPRRASAWRQRGIALVVFLAAGALGYALLDTPWFSAWNWYPVGPVSNDPGSLILLPLFTGLFGFSTLLLASRSRSEVPPQALDRGTTLPR